MIVVVHDLYESGRAFEMGKLTNRFLWDLKALYKSLCLKGDSKGLSGYFCDLCSAMKDQSDIR